jgi:hypothetical protein
VKLNHLHIGAVRDLVINEEFDAGREEQLAYLQMMAARQGKDAAKFIERVRGYTDPAHAKKMGAKATFERWVQAAMPGESRVGRSLGRRVKVTVLESETKAAITEGFFSDIGDIIMSKLRNILGDDNKEHALVAKALDRHPALTAIHRYARKAEQPIYDDENFWALIDKITSGKANEVKRLAHGTFKRISESKERVDVLSECTIIEARMTEVMTQLGLDQGTTDGLMRQFNLRDEDYDLARMRDALTRAKGRVEDAVRFMTELPSRALGKAGELVQGAAGAVAGAGKKIKSVTDSKRMQDENVDFADLVVSLAAVIMDIREADATTPQQVAQVVGQVAKVADPSIVGAEELGVNI